MALSAAEHVSLIDEAIQDILAGRASSYSIGNRSVTKLDIDKLYERREYYAALAARESRGGIFTLGAQRRPSR